MCLSELNYAPKVIIKLKVKLPVSSFTFREKPICLGSFWFGLDILGACLMCLYTFLKPLYEAFLSYVAQGRYPDRQVELPSYRLVFPNIR